MTLLDGIRPHMEVIGADGVHVGTVDRVENGRIRLTQEHDGAPGTGRHEGHHHYVPGSLVAEVEGRTIRLSANAAVAVALEQEADGHPRA